MGESKALIKLRKLKQSFAQYISQNFEHKALDCSTCITPCCADAQFVNINITRLEAIAILKTLYTNSQKNGLTKVEQIIERAYQVVREFHLSESGNTFSQTYPCPLYERGKGCLVHGEAKPAPCIQHGCYEDWRDLPETGTLHRIEDKIQQLNEQTYKETTKLMTIPMWLVKCIKQELYK